MEPGSIEGIIERPYLGYSPSDKVLTSVRTENENYLTHHHWSEAICK